MNSPRSSQRLDSWLAEVAYWFLEVPTSARVSLHKNKRDQDSAHFELALRGYLTKYDCSSADINPIGSIDKADLKRFISWAQVHFEIPCLDDFVTATPTAELEPITEDYVQSDEADMGMTYAELNVFGKITYKPILSMDQTSDKNRSPSQGEEDGPSVNVPTSCSCLGQGPTRGI